ncbi:MAG TPA: ABC transporter ATP-binding protein [Methanocorpusculum sp.]|nr:ABC transporter ATP-binding protein [Methanocorpusculum sp.]
MNISIKSLTQKYGKHTVLNDVSFSAETGKITALLGPNGCGKSTIIKTIAGILPCPENTIYSDGTDITTLHKADRAKMIGYVPQHFHYTAFTNVLDTVLIGRRPYMSWSVSEEDLKAVDSALRLMNIEDLSERYINELSGGQRQRVFIARALAQEPSFYIFDEPTSALDLRHQLETMSAMQNVVHAEKAGMIVALHDLNLALKYADSVVLLKDGCVYAEGKPLDVLTPEAVSDVYGVTSELVECRNGMFIHPYALVSKEENHDEIK